MPEPVVPGERPAEPPAPGVTCAQDHLRPFPAAPTPERGVDQIATSKPTMTGNQNQNQNGSAHPQAPSNGIDQPGRHDFHDPIPPLPEVIARIHARVQAFLAESHPPDSLLAAVQRQTRISLDVVAQALAQYQFSELSLSYNGGKDCLVLLILFLAGLHPHASDAQFTPRAAQDTPSTASTTPNPTKNGTFTSSSSSSSAAATTSFSISDIPSIYALPPDPFPAVEDFVRTSAQAYHLSITKYTTDPPHTTLRSSFEDYLTRHPGIRAIFVGTRRTDPHGAQLTHFDRTDHGWPDFMRIHPVIDWHYTEIWAFIRHLGLTYCSLYDMGYTSLGGTSDTHPNPRLEVDGEDGRYLPAYQLTEDLEERLGRN
ncbi:FAD synthase [Penicillium macrosclerotiorum]|uniref:FAD synthase n=1 Tax=Penicillium macrosclerotiorum TaxID=303699 RepID=UPI002546D35A|nr:FAD synthase [Penicillium macrosclerotiorum]KAJ5690812.1 FAD synthase [Penicillium macrosclerotiorum]